MTPPSHDPVRGSTVRGSTIGGIQVHQIVEVLQGLGMDGESLLAVVGVDVRALDDPWTRLPRWVGARLFSLAERRTGDRLIGLHAAERAHFHGPLAHLVASATRLRPALQLYERFCALAVDTSHVRLDVRGDTASLVVSLGPGGPHADRHLVDYALMAALRTCWRFARPGFGIREVHVRHPGRHYGSAAATAFGCAVRFEQAENRIVFPTHDLDQTLRTANPLVGVQIEKALAALPVPDDSQSTFHGRAEQAVRALLIAGRRADQSMVAKRLLVSVRSLQRRLEEEGASFRSLRDRVLRELVEAQLWNPALSIKEIALGAGFADVAAFSKAFRRWTGASPTTFRARGRSRAARRRTTTRRRGP